MDKEIPNEFNCPICLDVAYPPMMTSCGHLFCESCSKKIKNCSICRKVTKFNLAYSIKSFLDTIVSEKKELKKEQAQRNKLRKERIRQKNLEREQAEILEKIRQDKIKSQIIIDLT